MEKLKLAVIFGGMSTEHDVSIVSGSSVLKNLNKERKFSPLNKNNINVIINNKKCIKNV